MSVGFVIVCYNQVEVVRKTVYRALELGVPVCLVDNCSPDPRTRRFLREVEEWRNVSVLHPGKNLGCHTGFSLGFSHILEAQNCEILVKCDDDTLPPENLNLDEVESFFRKYKDIVVAGTNFFSDGRVTEDMTTTLAHSDSVSSVGEYLIKREYKTRFAFWDGVMNIPFGFIRASFYQEVGLHTNYRVASGEHVTSDEHLYGGEEVYLYQEAKKRGKKFGYFFDIKAEPVPYTEYDPDYILWKYLYGFLGIVKTDFPTFKQDELTKAEGYRLWLEHSDNGIHQELAKNYFLQCPN